MKSRYSFLIFALMLSAINFAHASYTINEKYQYVDNDTNDISSYPDEFISFNEYVFFVASDDDKSGSGESGDRHLYKINPTTNVHELVKNSENQVFSNVTDLKLFNSKLYFKSGQTIYVIDNQFNVDIATSDIVYQVKHSLVIENQLYVVADIGLGDELYLYTEAGLQLVFQFNSGAEDGVTTNLVEYEGDILLGGYDGDSQNLYRYSLDTNNMQQVSNLNVAEENEFYSIAVLNNRVYFSVSVKNIALEGSSSTTEGTKLYHYENGLVEQVEYFRDYWFSIKALANRLLFDGSHSGFYYGEDGECEALDPGIAIVAFNPLNSQLDCFINEGGLDYSYIQSYSLTNDFLYIDISYYNGFYLSDGRELYQVDLATNQVVEIYRSGSCLYEFNEINFNCASRKKVHAVAGNKLYVLSTESSQGYELASINTVNHEVEIANINEYSHGALNLYLEFAQQNSLYLVPYLSEQEREQRSQGYTRLTIDSQQNLNQSYWKASAPFSPLVNNTQDWSQQESLDVFNYNENVIELKFNTTSQLLTLTTINDGPDEIDEALTISTQNYENPLTKVPSVLIGDTYYFAIVQGGTETVYGFNLVTKEQQTLASLDPNNRVVSLFSYLDKLFMLTKNDGQGEILSYQDSSFSILHSVASVDANIKPQLIDTKLYFAGIRTLGEEKVVIEYDLVQNRVDSALATHSAAGLQSFAFFDDKVFFVTQHNNISQLYFVNAVNGELAEVALSDNITQPLDVIRFAGGIYFQALNQDGQPAIHSLTAPERYHVPSIDYTESLATGVQGVEYRSSLQVSDIDGDELVVDVISPHWLSYDAQSQQLVGRVVDNDDTGNQTVTLIVNDGYHYVSVSYELDIAQVLTVIEPTERVRGFYNEAFSYQLNVEYLGLGALSFSILNQGSFDSWLSIDESTGMLSGTVPKPAAPKYGENFSVLIETTDGEFSHRESITIYLSNYVLVVGPTEPMYGVLGEPLSVQFSAEFDDSLRFRHFDIAEELPEWLSLNPETGEISGIVPSDYSGDEISFRINAYTNYGRSDWYHFAIPFFGKHSFNNSPATSLNVDDEYEYLPDLTLGLNSGTERVFSIENKPEWASFDTTTGKLSGTPTTAGTFDNIVITVSDDYVSSSLDAFSITVNGIGAHTFANSPVTELTVSEEYEYVPELTLGHNLGSTLVYSIENKPDWASFDTTTGKLSGIPTTAGTFDNIVITVSDDYVSTSLDAFSITVNAIGAHTFANSPATELTVNEAYEYVPELTLGHDLGSTLVYSIENKPDWASFDTTSGKLSGTPTTAGTFGNIVITVSDDYVSTSSDAFSITVNAVTAPDPDPDPQPEPKAKSSGGALGVLIAMLTLVGLRRRTVFN